jgi:hypothetical protein
MSAPILNANEEAAICRRMIEAIETERKKLDDILLTQVLDHPEYLKSVSKRMALTDAITIASRIYREEFRT